MGYYLSLAYRYSSILMSFLLMYFLWGFSVFFFGKASFVGYALGWVGALQLFYLLYWLVASNMLIFFSRKLMIQFRAEQKEETLDDELLEKDPVQLEVFPGAKFWTISMIIIGVLGIYSAAWYIEEVYRISISEEILGKLLYLFVLVHTALMIIHSCWILMVLTKDGAWTRGEYRRR
jgi:hypothetical protein